MKYLHNPALQRKPLLSSCWTPVQIFFNVYTGIHIDVLNNVLFIYLNCKYDCTKQTCVYMYVYRLESINRSLPAHICDVSLFSAPDGTRLRCANALRNPLVWGAHSLLSYMCQPASAHQQIPLPLPEPCPSLLGSLPSLKGDHVGVLLRPPGSRSLTRLSQTCSPLTARLPDCPTSHPAPFFPPEPSFQHLTIYWGSKMLPLCLFFVRSCTTSPPSPPIVVKKTSLPT